MAEATALAVALRRLSEKTETINPIRAEGRVTDFVGLVIESDGPPVSVGDLCEAALPGGRRLLVQVIGFRSGRVLSMPLDEPEGLQAGCKLVALRSGALAPVGPELLGRTVDAFGKPIDGLGPLGTTRKRRLYAEAPGPLEREPIHTPLPTGIRAIDALTPCGRGQRIGIFGGAGVGKSTLLGALAKNAEADVSVIALIGERNREVRMFLEETLGEEGLKRSVVVAATSDRPAPLRVRAAFLATAIAEEFRSEGKDVLLIVDSATRLAMAQREISLAAGEPPSQKGYTPSVFQTLPKVFERAGSFERGSITGFYTVLVEGDDLNDPIADAVRSLLDGHIVLSRDLAIANHYPAIDVLQSLSRLAGAVSTPEQLAAAGHMREAMAAYRRAEDLIQLGAYAQGSSAKVDAAVRVQDELNGFLRQDLREVEPYEQTLERLQELADKL